MPTPHHHHHHSSSYRRFGTVLSANSPPRSTTSSRRHDTDHTIAKTTKPTPVRVRKSSSDNSSPATYTVTFDAGIQRLGLQCEPYDIISSNDNRDDAAASATTTTTGCRIQQFVDDGPRHPGPARATQMITPGDTVVEVNGHAIVSYEHAIGLLRDSTVTRTVVLQRNRPTTMNSITRTAASLQQQQQQQQSSNSKYNNTATTTTTTPKDHQDQPQSQQQPYHLPPPFRSQQQQQQQQQTTHDKDTNTGTIHQDGDGGAGETRNANVHFWDQPNHNGESHPQEPTTINSTLTPNEQVTEPDIFSTPAKSTSNRSHLKSGSDNPVSPTTPSHITDVSLIQSADDLVLLTKDYYNSSKKKNKSANRGTTSRRRRRHSIVVDSPAMTDASPRLNHHHFLTDDYDYTNQPLTKQDNEVDDDDDDDEQVLPVETMLQRDFAAHYDFQKGSGQMTVIARDANFHNDKRVPEAEREAWRVQILQETAAQHKEALRLARVEADQRLEAAVQAARNQAATEYDTALRRANVEADQRQDEALRQVECNAATEREQALCEARLDAERQRQEAIREVHTKMEKEKDEAIRQAKLEAQQQFENVKQEAVKKALEQAKSKADKAQEEAIREVETKAAKEREQALHRAKEEAAEQMENLRSQLSQRQEVVDQARLERDGAKQVIQQKIMLLDQVRRQWEQERNENLQKHEQLEEDLDHYRSKLSTLEREKQSSTETIRKLQNQLCQKDEQSDTEYRDELEQLRESTNNHLRQAQSKIEDLSTKLRESTSECATLHFSLDQEMAERAKVEERLDEVNNLLRDRQTELTDIQRVRDQSQQELEQLRITSETDVAHWKMKFENLANEQTLLKSQHEERVSRLQTEIDHLTRKLQTTDDNLRMKCDTDAAKSKKIDELETKILCLENDLRDKTDELQEAAHVIELLESKVESDEADFSEIRKLENEIQEMNAVTESRLAASRMEISELKRSLEEYESRHERLSRDKEDLAKMYNATVERLKLEQGKAEDVRLSLSAREAEIIELQSSLETRNADLDQRSYDLTVCQESLTKLQAERDTLAKRPEQTSEIHEFSYESLAKELIVTQDELSDANNRIVDLERLLRSLRRNVSESERRASCLRDQLSSERMSAKELKAKLNLAEQHLEEKMKRFSSNLTKLQENNMRVENEKSQLERQVKRLENEATSLKSTHVASADNLKSQNQQLQAERAAALEQVSKQKIEISSLSERLHVAKGECEQAHREIWSTRRRHAEEIETIKNNSRLKDEKYEAAINEKDLQIRGISKLKDEIRIIRGELSRTEKSMQRSREECDLLSALLDEVREDCAAKVEDLSSAHKIEQHRLSKINAETEQDHSKTKEKLRLVEKQLYEAEVALLDAKADRETLRTEKFNLSNEVQKLQDKLNEKSSDIETLRSSEETSLDFEEEPLSGLSPKELRCSWVQMREELEYVKNQLSESEANFTSSKQYCEQLEDQWRQLSEETSMLVNSNSHYEERLADIKKSHEESISALSAQQEQVRCMEESLRLTREQLTEKESQLSKITSDAMNLRSKLDEITSLNTKDKAMLSSRLTSLEQELGESEQIRSTMNSENMSLKATVSDLEENIAVLRRSLTDVQTQRKCLETEYEDSIARSKSLLNEASLQRDALETKLKISESESHALQNKISDNERALESATAELSEQSARLEEISQELEVTSSRASTYASERDDAKSSLAQAMQQAKSFKDNIHELEDQVCELERVNSLQSAQIENLRETVSHLEESSGASLSLRSKQLQDVEKKYASIESERDQLYGNIDDLREELRESRREAAGQENLVASLRNRVDNLSGVLVSTKEELKRASDDKDAVHSTLMQTQRELESKTREADHLKARLQVLNATVTRMKTDYTLLQDNVERTESETTSLHDTKDDEIARLQSKIQSQEAKLSSLSEVYKSQHQVLSLSQSLEGQLVQFVENVLHSSGDAIFDLASNISEIEELSLTLLQKNDDLTTAAVDVQTASELERVLNYLAKAIPQFKSKLEEKHEQLLAWKHRRSLRVAPGASSFQTPPPKSKSEPESPSVIQALEKMKQVLNDEILSPNKMRESNSQSWDSMYLQKVINALESQIDTLLFDLQSANEALKAKDQLFADMEQMVAHHEIERNNLESKLRDTRKSLRECETKLQQVEISTSPDDMARCNTINPCEPKIQASKMLANFLESRDVRAKAFAFRKWSNCLLSSRIKAQQGETAEALALELANTREKLLILKKHLKKSRRCKGQLQLGLDRIDEDNSSEEGNEIQ